MQMSESKKTKKNFLQNWIVRNLLIAAGVAVVLLVGAIVFLNVVTLHNKTIAVPDFTNMTVDEARDVASQAGMRVEVTDSVFAKRMKRGAIRDQNPSPGSEVKKGRRISLTINAVNAKKVTMPNLVSLSLRQAIAELQSRGLTVGKLIYVKDIATNNVIRQLSRNREIEPGTLVETETVIDLVVGLNPDTDNVTYVPDVVGRRYINAVDAVRKQSLNIKSLKFDETVKTYDDRLSAVVYRQIPAVEDSVTVRMGDEVTLYFTLDQTRIPAKK